MRSLRPRSGGGGGGGSFQVCFLLFCLQGRRDTCKISVHNIRGNCIVQCITIIQLLKLVSSADWSKVHHVTNGILGKDWWWSQPVIIRLSRPVVIYAHASYRFCTASMAYASRIRIRKYSCSCARFLIVEPTERLIRVKAGRKMSKNLWNYMHLSVL